MLEENKKTRPFRNGTKKRIRTQGTEEGHMTRAVARRKLIQIYILYRW